MKILVAGAKGMLGQELVPILESRGHAVLAYDRAELDITDYGQTMRMVRHARPDAIVNAAAATNVDGCETAVEDAYRVNAGGTQALALACQDLGIPLMYISTDYVFDGTLGRAYREWDATNPQSVYGASKLAGERIVEALLTRFYIVRTSWLYGRHGKNFVETMRRLGREKPELAVVADQHGAPTWTVPLCHTMAHLLESHRYGVYHATGQGATTWHGFTERILALEGLKTPVNKLTTAELGRPAPRPAYSVLENMALRVAGLPLLPHWEESLAAYMAACPFEPAAV